MNLAGDIQAFAAACEARLPLRLHVTDERSGRSEEVLLDRPFAVIGSAETCDVRLVHPDVSRNHAYLQVLNGRVLCSDLASRTGTHWGSEIRFRSWMQPGDAIQFGPFSVKLVDDSDDRSRGSPSSTALSRPVRVRQPNMVLTFLNARSRSGRSRISRVRNPVTLIGWSHLCHLRLQHRSVGRVHCSLVWTPSGLWGVDLMCRGGTRVNGELINFVHLDDDDDLQMGRFQLRIAYGSSAEMPIFTVAEEDSQQRSADWDDSQGMDVDIDLDESNPRTLKPPRLAHDTHRDPPRTLVRIAGAAPELAALSTSPSPYPMPIAPALPAVGAVDANTAALMQQFATMQQQMFDHTFQLLAVVTEAFQTAHNRQMDLIREELVRVHDLNRELQELNQRRGTVDVGVPPGPAVGEMLPNTPGVDAVFRQLQSAMSATVAAAPPVAASGKPAAADSDSISPSNADQTKPEPVALRAGADVPKPAPAAGPRPFPPDNRKKDARDPAAVATGARRPKRGEAAAPDVPAAAKSSEPDVHAWLSGRIDDLTKERSSRWQRILQLLTNGGR